MDKCMTSVVPCNVGQDLRKRVDTSCVFPAVVEALLC